MPRRMVHHKKHGTMLGGRCRPGSLALGVGQMFVIHTPWVKISVVSNVKKISVAPTLSTAHQHQEAAEGEQEEIDPEGCGTEGQTVSMRTSMK